MLEFLMLPLGCFSFTRRRGLISRGMPERVAVSFHLSQTRQLGTHLRGSVLTIRVGQGTNPRRAESPKHAPIQG